MQIIYLGADHGGFALKEKIKKWLIKSGYRCVDLGNAKFEPTDDYPDFAFKVGEAVSQNPNALGILICRSGAGMVIAANKVKGVRAAAAFDQKSAKHSRRHNNTNVLVLSGDWFSYPKAKKIVAVWLKTNFSGEERHQRRLLKISQYENKN